MFGLDHDVLEKIRDCLRKYPTIRWVKIYGSRAKGNYTRVSDIDLCFSSEKDISASLLAALDALPTPYFFDVTHYESIENEDLQSHIDRIGIIIFIA